MQYIPHIYDCLAIPYGVSIVHLLLVAATHLLLVAAAHLLLVAAAHFLPVESN
jgi:hypothetical protein